MRTDTQLIESYLQRTLNENDTNKVDSLRAADPVFRQNLLFQAKVYFAALVYGRTRRRTEILKAGERAFSDPDFTQLVTTIFK